MKRYDATAPSIQPAPSLLRRTAEGVVGGALLGLLIVAGALVAMSDASPLWLVPIALAALSPLLLAARSNAEILRDMIERVTQRDIDGDGQIGTPGYEPFRLVVARGPDHAQRRQDTDLAWAIHRSFGVGWGWRQWRGVRLPSSETVDQERWQRIVADLAKAGLITAGEPGKSARWVCDEVEVMQRLGLTHPA